MLSNRRQLFVSYFLRYNDPVQAAIAAGYKISSIDNALRQLLNDKAVCAEIEHRRIANTGSSETFQVESLMPQLPLRKKLFVEHYVRTGNATQSARLAGYSEKTAYSQGHRLLGKRDIQTAISSLLKSDERTLLDASPLGLPAFQKSLIGGFVYLIREPFGLVKIGKATDPLHRLKTLQTACPYELELIGVLPCVDMNILEEHLHAHYGAKLIRGEWFSLTDDDVAEILRDYGKETNA